MVTDQSSNGPTVASHTDATTSTTLARPATTATATATTPTTATPTTPPSPQQSHSPQSNRPLQQQTENNQQQKRPPLLILLGGATCGGKSTLANRLQHIWPNIKRLSQDDYFREEQDPNHVWITLSDGFRHQDWEHEQSVDWNRMRADLKQLMDDLTADSGQDDMGAQRPMVVLEGHLVLTKDWSQFTSNQISFFFTIDKQSCHSRRIQRTYIPQDPPTYFDDHVWPQYLLHEQQMRAQDAKVHFVSGNMQLDQLYVLVEQQVRQHL